MLPIRNISYLSPMCCNFWEKCMNSHKIGQGCSTPLRDHNCVHFAHRLLVYCYLEFKLCYVKNLKSFSIGVKEIFEPIILQTKSLWVFALFKKNKILRNQCLSNARWFYSKKTTKLGKENLYLTENRLSRNEMWCATDIHNNMCHICAKGFLVSNFD